LLEKAGGGRKEKTWVQAVLKEHQHRLAAQVYPLSRKIRKGKKRPRSVMGSIVINLAPCLRSPKKKRMFVWVFLGRGCFLIFGRGQKESFRGWEKLLGGTKVAPLQYGAKC